ncbi:unnamed protein product [Umbelopsis sp. WA50703]
MSKAIRAIDERSVHRICSGQVVLDLATAVKELVENSLDAGATAIDVRFKDYGVESLEVIDNGSGLEPSDYETLALKHYTSKISKFEDLEEVATFGFRGEALSSLCALANLTVTTSTAAQSPTGYRMEYDANGKLVSKQSIARSTGTTIQLTNLFQSLPVRYKEFKKNIKREFTKALNIIQSYAIISPNIRISASNQMGKGSSNKILNCNANKTIRENIANIFGAKAVAQTISVDLTLHQDQTSVSEDEGNGESRQIKVVGYISKPIWGHGRSSADRQYMYINGRPCNLPKMTRTLNEIFRSFISNQYPFAALDFRIPNGELLVNLPVEMKVNQQLINISNASLGEFDVNVSPDKRTIFIHNEKWISDQFAEQLNQLLEPTRYTLPINELRRSEDLLEEAGAKDIVSESLTSKPMDSEMEDSSTISTQNDISEPEITVQIRPPRQQPYTRPRFNLSEMAHSSGKMFMPTNDESATVKEKRALTQSTLDVISVKRHRTVDVEQLPDNQSDAESDQDANTQDSEAEGSVASQIEDDSEAAFQTDEARAFDNYAHPQVEIQPAQSVFHVSFDDDEKDEHLNAMVDDRQDLDMDLEAIVEDSKEEDKLTTSPVLNYEEIQTDDHPILSSLKPSLGTCNLSKQVEVDAAVLLQQCRRRMRTSYQDRKRNIQRESDIPLMNANISNSLDNDQATKTLNRVIRKVDFLNMRVIGQFNLGFIIAMLNEADLFIVDQHASDEKYNFETLQQTTQIKGQKLIHPRAVELTASEELVAMDNIDILKANGFDIQVDENAPSTQKIRIVSQPVSKNTMFNMKDFEELVFLLSERPGEMVRCSKARSMFASRACRKSVMIGHSLGKQQMIKV